MDKPPLNAVIVTIGLLILLEGLAGIFYGGQYRSFPAAFSIIGLKVGTTPLGVSRFDVFVAAAVLVTTLALAAAFRYTSAGLRMRAAAFNPTIARLSGIRVGARCSPSAGRWRACSGRWPGVLVSPSTFLYPNSMDAIFVFGFTAAVIGGLDSPVGAVVGGLLLGDRAQLRGGLPGLQGLRPDLPGRARHPRRGADDPARRAVLRRQGPAGMTMQTLPRRLGVAVLVAVIVAFLSIKLNAFRDYQIAEIAYEVTAVAGLTVLTGLSGQISLGNGAFMAIGAYTDRAAAAAPQLAVHRRAGGWPPRSPPRPGPSWAWPRPGCAARTWPARPSCSASRCRRVAYAWPGVFGGDQGLNVAFTTPAFLGATFPLTRWQAWVSAAVALVTLVLLANLCYSRIGRNWRAVRDDEVAAALDGVNVAATRILAFVVSAVCAGLAGSLLAIVTSAGRAGRLHDHALHRAADGGRDRRPRQPARRAVGKPRDRPRAHLRHGRGHQPRPVQFRRIQHPDSRLWRGPHPRHARLPAGNPGRAATSPHRFHRS